MKKIALLLSLILVFTGCNFMGGKGSGPLTFGDVKTDFEFPTEPLEDAIYSMMIEPTPKSAPKDSFLISILDGSDAEWVGDNDWASNYQIIQVDDGKTYATVKLTTTPPDLKAFFGVTTDAEVQEKLIPEIFTTEDVYTGLKKAAGEDFGYKITTDWQGNALGWKAFYIEFLDEESNNHALRFYMSNDKIDEMHVAVTINANIPADRTDLIEKYRKMIFSISKA